MNNDLRLVLSPTANEEEAAAIMSAMSVYFASISSVVDKVEDNSNSWVIKHRLQARKALK